MEGTELSSENARAKRRNTAGIIEGSTCIDEDAACRWHPTRPDPQT